MIDFYDVWFKRGQLKPSPEKSLSSIAFGFLRLRALLEARAWSKCSHEVLGDRCELCGWPFRLMNVYEPEGMKLDRRFLRVLRKELPPGVRIMRISGATAPQLGTVGFEIAPLHFVRLQSAFHSYLRPTT